MKNPIKKILQFRMFHPAEWFVNRESTIDPQVLNPPSWRERKIQNEMIDRQYEESVKAKSNDQLAEMVALAGSLGSSDSAAND